MRFLVIGDFHGDFPERLIKLIKKEKIELVVSNGDYFPFHYRRLWFKYSYRKERELWEIIGKKKYKELVIKDLKMGERALKKLNDMGVPAITVVGNVDYSRGNDQYDFKNSKRNWKWDDQDFFSKIILKYKNISRFDYSFFKFNDYTFIGASGGSSPGDVKSKAYRKSKRKLDELFIKFKKENKKGKVIFVSHNVPFNTRLDKITWKDAEKSVKGKHYGSKLVRRIIEKYQPVLAFGGHIHESWGKDRLGKTEIVNPGAIHEGKYAIVDINGKKRKIKFGRI
ncbi:MAG: metallophosphoesterase [Nanoarchaeota archaeon]|nr:metallophosphoesterase [Nanoarchaeota archaeon]